VPLLGQALPLIGHFQIRNRGTVGGSIAHADPASELPAIALALDAQLEVANTSGTRTIPASTFFEGTWTTSLRGDEVLAAVRFPVWSGTCGFAVEEVARRHGDFAIAGAAVGVELSGGAVTRAAIALFGMGATPVRVEEAEKAVTDGQSPAEVGKAAVQGLEPPDDIHASGEYRRQVGAVLVERALQRAMKEAGRV
jgi:carbon-monoxide dehydrogenase medium subunit